jgi:hypothetical protein
MRDGHEFISYDADKVSFDTQVRVALYRLFVASGRAPARQEIAEVMNAPIEDVRAALERLAEAKAIVLQPHSRELLMAAPLSAVPTPYLVRLQEGHSYFAPCAWDGLGVMAMLRREAELMTSCACCGEAISLTTDGAALAPAAGIIHFAIPAREWWTNIVFT